MRKMKRQLEHMRVIRPQRVAERLTLLFVRIVVFWPQFGWVFPCKAGLAPPRRSG
jgi:hypothetical protein